MGTQKEVTRRRVLAMGGSAMTSASLAAGLGAARANPLLTASLMSGPAGSAIAAFTGGAPLHPGTLVLTAPALAENGFTVPVEFVAPGAAEVALFAGLNPEPRVVTFRFGPLSASPAAATRIRLAASQTLIAIARMQDDSFQIATAEVDVTIGGCGA